MSNLQGIGWQGTRRRMTATKRSSKAPTRSPANDKELSGTKLDNAPSRCAGNEPILDSHFRRRFCVLIGFEENTRESERLAILAGTLFSRAFPATLMLNEVQANLIPSSARL